MTDVLNMNSDLRSNKTTEEINHKEYHWKREAKGSYLSRHFKTDDITDAAKKVFGVIEISFIIVHFSDVTRWV